MAQTDRYDHGHGTVWQDVFVHRREGYYTSVVNYHKHGFYELNLILSGNVRILLREGVTQSTGNTVVMTRPGTPHYITCRPDALYQRLYLVFTADFVERCAEWSELSDLFGAEGTVLSLTAEQTKRFADLIGQIDGESSRLRQRLLTFYLLSCLLELTNRDLHRTGRTPPYILEALSFLEEHYDERLVAATLAKRLNVSRTTLMTEFKRYTERTLVDYLTHCRLANALRLLREGKTVEDVAERCGFADSSGLNRAFRRCYGMTPRQYAEQNKSLR